MILISGCFTAFMFSQPPCRAVMFNGVKYRIVQYNQFYGISSPLPYFPLQFVLRLLLFIDSELYSGQCGGWRAVNWTLTMKEVLQKRGNGENWVETIKESQSILTVELFLF